MGRPFKILTPVQIAEVETLAAVLTVGQMADYLGIGRTTFFSIMDRDPEVAERYKKGKARAIGAIAQSLIAKARAGDTTSMIFYLKTQGGWRERVHLETFEGERPVADAEAEIDLSGMSDGALLELSVAVEARDARLRRASEDAVLFPASAVPPADPDVDGSA